LAPDKLRSTLFWLLGKDGAAKNSIQFQPGLSYYQFNGYHFNGHHFDGSSLMAKSLMTTSLMTTTTSLMATTLMAQV